MAGGPAPFLTITVRSAAVRVTAEPGAELAARKGDLEADGAGRWRIDSPSTAVEVVCPEGTALAIANTSGKVECRGGLGEVKVTASSGRVAIERASEVDVRTTSGRVDIGTCSGSCTVRTTSSRVDVGRADHADIATTSGRITLGEVRTAEIQSVSGAVQVAAANRPDLRVRTMSAGVEVEVAEGPAPATDLRSVSGKVRARCPEGDAGRIEVETVSGSITVTCR